MIVIEIFNGEEGHSRWVAVLLVFVRAGGGDQTALVRKKLQQKIAAKFERCVLVVFCTAASAVISFTRVGCWPHGAGDFVLGPTLMIL